MSTKNKWKYGGEIKGLEVMCYFNRDNYKRIIKRFEKLAKKMTLREIMNDAAVKTAKDGALFIKNAIAKKTTYPESELGKRIKAYNKGTIDRAIGVKISDAVNSLNKFALIPGEPKYRTAPSAEIYKGDRKTYDKGAFVAKMKGGHIGVFEREKEKRLNVKKRKKVGGEWVSIMDEESEEHIHIHEIFGPSVTGMFKADEDLHTKTWGIIFNSFETHVERELERLLNG